MYPSIFTRIALDSFMLQIYSYLNLDLCFSKMGNKGVGNKRNIRSFLLIYPLVIYIGGSGISIKLSLSKFLTPSNRIFVKLFLHCCISQIFKNEELMIYFFVLTDIALIRKYEIVFRNEP